MKVCARCNKINPDDARYCLQCGNFISNSKLSTVASRTTKWVRRIPAIGWIAIGLIGLVVGLATIIGSFWAIATMSGIASIIFLIAGCFAFGVYRRGNFTTNSIFRAVAIGFFALMGATVDQTGNYLYNLPIEKISCPIETTLGRRADVNQPMPGTTVITQDFSCYNKEGERVYTVNMFAVMGYRFVEYVILAYLLISLRWVFNHFRKRSTIS